MRQTPYGTLELKRVIDEIKWSRSYIKTVYRQYPELSKSHTNPAENHGLCSASLVKHYLDSPLAFLNKTEGPERDPTWLQALPTEALRLFMKHALDVAQGLNFAEIRGALQGAAADRYSVERFNKAARVNLRFTTPFLIAYDSLVGLQQAESADAVVGPGGFSDESAGTNMAVSADKTHESQAEEKRHDSRETTMSSFRRQCEQHCARELEARMVLIVAEGANTDIKTAVTNTHLYHNFTMDASVMAFYDVKNATLCNIYEGEGVIMFTVCSPPRDKT